MYKNIQKKLDSGQTIILDGGTGTDIQRRGVPMSGETWCAEVNLTHPDIVRPCTKITSRRALTSLSPTPLPPAPFSSITMRRDDDLLKIDRAAVAIAKQAAARKSQWRLPVPFPPCGPWYRDPTATKRTCHGLRPKRARLFRRKAENLAKAGVDLIMME